MLNGNELHYKRMAKNIARFAGRPLENSFERADGDVECHLCRLPYFEHPRAPEAECLTMVCDGRRVKL